MPHPVTGVIVATASTIPTSRRARHHTEAVRRPHRDRGGDARSSRSAATPSGPRRLTAATRWEPAASRYCRRRLWRSRAPGKQHETDSANHMDMAVRYSIRMAAAPAVSPSRVAVDPSREQRRPLRPEHRELGDPATVLAGAQSRVGLLELIGAAAFARGPGE